MFKLDHVNKTYNHRSKSVKALDSVNLEISQGEFISIIGSSGSGKSTLLLILGGMLSPTKGKVFLEGESLYELTPDQRAQVRQCKLGFVFQTFNLVPYLSALENVQIPLFLAGKDEIFQKERAAGLLDRVGLADRLNHKPAELSVGQQQRVALARVLANNPSIILADEPTGNLDPETKNAVLDFLAELSAEGRTIIMVTHDPQAAKAANRTLRLADGVIFSDKTRNLD